MARPDDVAYAARVATNLASKERISAEEALDWLTKYKESLERYGRKARERSSAVGLLKRQWGAVRAAILDINDRDRAAGKRPGARPRPRPERRERDHRPDWARREGAPEYLITSMERRGADPGEPLMILGGRTFGARPGGWFAVVEGATGSYTSLSKLDGEVRWYADAMFGPGSYPVFSHGDGDRSVGKQVAKEPLHTYLERAQALAAAGHAGPYDPRALGADAPGQMRMFNPGARPGEVYYLLRKRRLEEKMARDCQPGDQEEYARTCRGLEQARKHHACYCPSLPQGLCDYCSGMRKHCGDISCENCRRHNPAARSYECGSCRRPLSEEEVYEGVCNACGGRPDSVCAVPPGWREITWGRWTGFQIPPDIPGSPEDSTWKNDASMSFRWPDKRLRLWIDHPDPEKRETGGEGTRFILQTEDEEGAPDLDVDDLLQSEEWEPMREFIKARLSGRAGNPAGTYPSHCEACGRPLEAHQASVFSGGKGWHKACYRRGNPTAQSQGFRICWTQKEMKEIGRKFPGGVDYLIPRDRGFVKCCQISPSGLLVWDGGTDASTPEAQAYFWNLAMDLAGYDKSKAEWGPDGRKRNPSTDDEWARVARMSSDAARKYFS